MGEEQQDLVGKILQETYRLERLVGEGGMGTVYEASHLRVRRRFAIKLLSPVVANFPEAVARFRREGEITSELGHPNIVDVIDSNITPEGAPYIVMEMLEGESLGSRLARAPALTLEEVASILKQTGSALHAAHQHGIVHRDLKPQNIFLCRQGEQADVVKVLDFGISKVLGSQSILTSASMIMGTPSYMAPEQAQGRVAEIDARTDIYAVGAILYEMLAGQPPFAGENVTAVLYQTVHEEPPPLHSLCPGLPPGVVQVVSRALRKRPEDRYGTIEELAHDFSRAMLGQSITAIDQTGPSLRRVPATLKVTARLPSGGAVPERPVADRQRRAFLLALGGAAIAMIAGASYLGLRSHKRRHPSVEDRDLPLAAGGVDQRSASASGHGGTDGAAVLSGRSTRDAGPADRHLRLATDTGPASADLPHPAAPARAVGHGQLRVVTFSRQGSVWADVYIDRRKTGQSPLVLKRVGAGEHVVEVRRGGYQTARKTVLVQPNKEITLRMELRRRR